MKKEINDSYAIASSKRSRVWLDRHCEWTVRSVILDYSLRLLSKVVRQRFVTMSF